MGNNPFLVGITGGIGSGKSIVCQVFRALGIPVYDADTAAKRLMHENEALKDALQTTFGAATYQNGSLNREYLGKLVFSNPEKLARLNALTHPAVGKDFEEWVDAHATSPYAVKEAALLIESGMNAHLDLLVLVTAPTDIRIARVVKRDTHRTEQDVRLVIQRQMPEEEKQKFCQVTILNDGVHAVLPQILEIDAQFRSASR